MKRFLNIFFSFVIFSSAIIFSACSDKSNEDDISTPNEEYYLALGYHYIIFDDFTNIICDENENNIVFINENKIMLPHNSNFSLSFNLSKNIDFTLNNQNYINFKTGKILSGFTDETNTYEIYENSLKLKNDVNVSATFESFKVLGVAIFPIENNDVSFKPELCNKFNTFPTNYSNLLYYYSKVATYESFSNDTNDLICSTGYKTTATTMQNGKFELDIALETFLNTTSVYAYLILQDNFNNFYFYEKPFSNEFMTEPLVFDNLSNSISNIEKITLSLSYDLSTKDEY